VYEATRETFVAQMLNLTCWMHQRFSKGCYTGKKSSRDSQHLGRIKRRMFHLSLPAGRFSVGEPIRLSDGRQGRIVEMAEVRKARSVGGAQSGGRPAEVRTDLPRLISVAPAHRSSGGHQVEHRPTLRRLANLPFHVRPVVHRLSEWLAALQRPAGRLNETCDA